MNRYRYQNRKQGGMFAKLMGCGCLCFVGLFLVGLVSVAINGTTPRTIPTEHKEPQKAIDQEQPQKAIDQPKEDAEAAPHTVISHDGKTVHVKGYTRKNGTYVKSYTRSK